MVRFSIFMTLCITVLVGCGETKAKKKPITLQEIPPKIMDIAREKLPDVKFENAWLEPNGSFELKGKGPNGKTREIDIRPDGTIEEIQ